MHFDEAEAFTTDPGLVAFNRAAALFRLGRYAEDPSTVTAVAWRTIRPRPPAGARRLRSRRCAGQAGRPHGHRTPRPRRHLHRCALATPGLDSDLRGDGPAQPGAGPTPLAQGPNQESERPSGEGDDRPGRTRSRRIPARTPAPSRGPRKARSGAERSAAGAAKRKPGRTWADQGANPGRTPQVLPDQDHLVSIPPADADAHLDALAARIAPNAGTSGDGCRAHRRRQGLVRP